MRLLKTTALLTAIAALAAVSCHRGIQPDVKLNPEKGYLQLSGLNVECVADHRDDNANAATRSAATRAVDINTFDCYILDETGNTQIMTFKYGEKPATAIELDAGKYIFKMISGEIPNAAWENPVYGLTEPFTIVRKETTNLTELVCTLQNIQATIAYSADLKACLSDDTTATLSIGEAALVYSMTETRSGYFKAVNTTNDLDLLIKGIYTPDLEGATPSEFEFNTTIKDVKAGQWSDIQLYIEYSGEGGISLSVTIDGWVVDEQLVFDVSQHISELPVVDDDDKPTVVLREGDIDAPVSLFATDFDANGNCTKDIIIDISTLSTIAGLTVEMDSTNGDFLSSLSSFNIPQSFDLCSAGTASSALKLMGLPVNDQVLGQPSVTYDITAQMKLLKEFGGTHSFNFTVTDAQGGATEKTLQIVIEGGNSGPSVTWKGGYDFNTRYPITDELTVDLSISVPSGIEEFIVTIDSEVLTPSQLKGVGLCDNLDLCDPSDSFDSSLDDPTQTNTSGVLSALKNFGFMPDSGEVDEEGNPIYLDTWRGQTTANLSITKFLSLLKVTGQGSHDFIFNITDSEGNKLTKTLMLVTE